jgi:hypothetical protein
LTDSDEVDDAILSAITFGEGGHAPQLVLVTESVCPALSSTAAVRTT